MHSRKPHLFVLLVLLSLRGLAVADSSSAQEVVYKAFPKETVKTLQEDSDYIYPLSQGTAGLTPWQKFMRWLGDFFSFQATAVWWEYLLYIAIFVILVFAAIKLLGIRFNSLLAKPDKADALPYTLGEENLQSLQFSKEIEEAMAAKNWRLVVRLRYLQALFILSEKELLRIKQGKTNHDYLYELKAGAGREQFAQLARLFDYVWYGHFEAEEVHIVQSEGYLKALIENTSAPIHA